MSDDAVLILIVRLARFLLPMVMMVSGWLMHRRLRFDGAAMRQLGINGEVALVHEGWRRDAVGLVVTGGVIFLATLTHPKWDTVEATGVVSRHFSPISMDDMALLFLAAVGAWLGVKRLKDRRFAEVLAAARRRKELGMPARPHQGDYSHGDK